MLNDPWALPPDLTDRAYRIADKHGFKKEEMLVLAEKEWNDGFPTTSDARNRVRALFAKVDFFESKHPGDWLSDIEHSIGEQSAA